MVCLHGGPGGTNVGREPDGYRRWDGSLKAEKRSCRRKKRMAGPRTSGFWVGSLTLL